MAAGADRRARQQQARNLEGSRPINEVRLPTGIKPYPYVRSAAGGGSARTLAAGVSSRGRRAAAGLPAPPIALHTVASRLKPNNASRSSAHGWYTQLQSGGTQHVLHTSAREPRPAPAAQDAPPAAGRRLGCYTTRRREVAGATVQGRMTHTASCAYSYLQVSQASRRRSEAGGEAAAAGRGRRSRLRCRCRC